MDKILLVDDEAPVLHAIKRELLLKNRDAYHIELTTSPREALSLFQQQSFDLIISDYRMPEMDGIDLLIEAKNTQPDMMRVILTGQADMGMLVDAVNKAQIYRYLTKPWRDYELKSVVSLALDHAALKKHNHDLETQVSEITARAIKQKRLIDKIKLKHPELIPDDWSDEVD